ncbi:MAG: hypothetical protein PHI18_02640 [bacterium]|nr:hypothetical protein [bacterium]
MTSMAAAETIRIFFSNRLEFYRMLLDRIPEPKFKEYLRQVIEPHLANTEPPPDPVEIHLDKDSLLPGLCLGDLLKKDGYGRALARTAISFEDALKRAQSVEETGLLFFQAIAEAAQEAVFARNQMDSHRQCLNGLLLLDDAVRYRKIAMPTGPESD